MFQTSFTDTETTGIVAQRRGEGTRFGLGMGRGCFARWESSSVGSASSGAGVELDGTRGSFGERVFGIFFDPDFFVFAAVFFKSDLMRTIRPGGSRSTDGSVDDWSLFVVQRRASRSLKTLSRSPPRAFTIQPCYQAACHVLGAPPGMIAEFDRGSAIGLRTSANARIFRRRASAKSLFARAGPPR